MVRWCHEHKSWTSDNWKRPRDMVRWVVLHAVPYTRKILRLENTQGSLQSGNSGSTVRHGEVLWWFMKQYHGRIFCLSLHGRITAREYVNRWLTRCIPWSRRYFRTTMQFSNTTMPPVTQLELFSYGLKSMEVNFIIFLGPHSLQFWTSLDHSGQFWRREWVTDSHLQYLWATWRCSSRRMVQNSTRY
jgi:hypothetical protein